MGASEIDTYHTNPRYNMYFCIFGIDVYLYSPITSDI